MQRTQPFATETYTMRRPRFRIRTLMIAIAFGAILVVLSTRIVAHQRNVQRKKEARYAAAAEAYASVEIAFRTSRVELADVCEISRLLFEAQRDLGDSAAAADHLKRMQKLRACFADPRTRHLRATWLTADLYVKEAELWVAKEEW